MSKVVKLHESVNDMALRELAEFIEDAEEFGEVHLMCAMIFMDEHEEERVAFILPQNDSYRGMLGTAQLLIEFIKQESEDYASEVFH